MSNLAEIEKLNETIATAKKNAARDSRYTIFGVAMAVMILLAAVIYAIMKNGDDVGFAGFIVTIACFGSASLSTYMAAVYHSSYLTAMLSHSEAVTERAARILQSNDR